MDTRPGDLTMAQGPLESVRDELLSDAADVDRVQNAADVLRDISRAAYDASRADLTQLADLLANLLSIACSLDVDTSAEEADQLVQFVRDGLSTLQLSLDDVASADAVQGLWQEANDRWGDCLELVNDSLPGEDTAWNASSQPDAAADEEEMPVPELGQIGAILNSLAAVAEIDNAPAATRMDPQVHATHTPPRAAGTGVPATTRSVDSTIDDPLVLDAEIREAYLDDAQRCLASIEASLLAFEQDPANRQPLRQVCRELHTLKGASASVGLSRLARLLHQTEDDLQAACEQPGGVQVEPILQCVDLIRRQIQHCGEQAANESTAPAAGTSPGVSHRESFAGAAQPAQDSVRVNAAQLDRLMDLLAELVMLRNRRESRVEQLKGIHGELARCVSRVRVLDDRLAPGMAAFSAGESRGAKVDGNRRRVGSLTEIANDLLELGRSLRELYEPVADENLTISRFIRHFRQELMQLRRVPLGGLFRRLQRAARDVARIEGKKAQLVLVGEDVGLERSIQEQLYEPLLHMVRNAVSHGIESESTRIAAGKNPLGTVTLEAHGGSNLLVVTVRDDGRGLDYDALRRRGIEMGLIPIDRPATRSELSRLIFHAGLSTRRDATEVSGRGVGMDVVATTLERMHSWVEVDSTPGAGTTIRLLIPRHSVIEHVMVFRSGGQEFGLPTQFVQTAGPWQEGQATEFPLLPFARLCPGLLTSEGPSLQLIVLAHGWQRLDTGRSPASATGAGKTPGGERRLGLLVDEIVGPEEVVVRPLPGLLKDQRLFSGVTLSGTGDIMLLFDSQRLLERGMQLAQAPSESPADDAAPRRPASTDRDSRRRALIVDDSRSARRTLVQCLTPRGWATDEANDGLQALKLLRSHTYDLVLTDLEMPQLGGMELLREIRANARTQALPVIIVTSRDEDKLRKDMARLGVMAYLTKPISDRSLAEVIARQMVEQPRNVS